MTKQTRSKADSKKNSRPTLTSRLFFWLLGIFVCVTLIFGLLISYAVIVMQPQLPPLTALTNYHPQMPLRIYTADHVLIGEFGQERRKVVSFDQIPQVMKEAVLAIEDYRFYEHGGIDFIGILRAGITDILHGGAREGASTITMQVARNFFLSRKKTYTRKLYEMMLAYEIEKTLTKDQILDIYMNQIYLGQRSYGFAAAAQTYFGVDIKNITLAQAAMLAGLPKAPSAYNPVVNFKRAKIRQEYILKRMYKLKYITKAQYEEALNEKLHIHNSSNQYAVHAGYLAEMARQKLVAQYGDAVYNQGISVITTVNSKDQEAAYRALRQGILNYEMRQGYRGPEGFVNLSHVHPEKTEQALIDETLNAYPDNDEWVAGVVMSASPEQVIVGLAKGKKAVITGKGLEWVKKALAPDADKHIAIRQGSVIRLKPLDKESWEIVQLPKVQGALVAISPQNGAVRALVGGFHFYSSNFNHVTQAWRQPGSSFKPFIYSAALEKGIGPATMVNDAPLFFPPSFPGGQAWAPKDDDKPEGWMTVRRGLQLSKNLVAIRVLANIGTTYAQQFVTRCFGFDLDKTPPYLPMALGAGLVTPMQLVNGYSVFANGGYKVEPYFISKVLNSKGQVLEQTQPIVAGVNAQQVISTRNAYIMNDLLHTVATKGTGAPTNVLGRSDLQGKTGTTNEAKDGWFAGYQQSLAAVVWMGYDQPKSLGRKAYGSQVALPIWIDFMRTALRNIPIQTMPMPAGLTTTNGELYYDDKTPGNGFVSRIQLHDDGRDISASDALGKDGEQGMQPPAIISPTERQQILDMFEN